jgi:hypothetical protein
LIATEHFDEFAKTASIKAYMPRSFENFRAGLVARSAF